VFGGHIQPSQLMFTCDFGGEMERGDPLACTTNCYRYCPSPIARPSASLARLYRLYRLEILPLPSLQPLIISTRHPLPFLQLSSSSVHPTNPQNTEHLSTYPLSEGSDRHAFLLTLVAYDFCALSPDPFFSLSTSILTAVRAALHSGLDSLRHRTLFTADRTQ